MANWLSGLWFKTESEKYSSSSEEVQRKTDATFGPFYRDLKTANQQLEAIERRKDQESEVIIKKISSKALDKSRIDQ